MDLHGHLSSERQARQVAPFQEYLSFQMTALSSHLHKITVSVGGGLVSQLLDQSVELFRKTSFEGFGNSGAPKKYIEDSYKSHIHHKVKNFAFQHLVVDFVFIEIFNRKIIMANYPRLVSAEFQPDNGLVYIFDMAIADPLELKEWKHFAFKSPKRKKYKDLDKQVVSFVENRAASNKKVNPSLIEEYDWVLIDTVMVNAQDAMISASLSGSFWIKIGNQEIAHPLINQLIGKQQDNSFYTTDLDLYEIEDGVDKHSFKFLVTVKSIIKGQLFSMDVFKSTFRLKNKQDIHNKLMEIFSYRNDISQRKAIIEEVFHLLLSKHRFEVPKHLVLRREEHILQTLIKQPDYHVYKAQKDFKECIQMLAEKQLKEEIIIDHIAYHENIHMDLRDMQQYLHLLSNRRLKEFIYFRPLSEHLDDAQAMLNMTTLAQAVIREKTLNYVIYTLTH